MVVNGVVSNRALAYGAVIDRTQTDRYGGGVTWQYDPFGGGFRLRVYERVVDVCIVGLVRYKKRDARPDAGHDARREEGRDASSGVATVAAKGSSQ